MSSCNYFNVEKIKREDVKKNQLEDIKQSFTNYPEIYSCEGEENSKTCFERQLNEHLESRLKDVVVNEGEITKDTLWLTVNVSRTGKLTLKPVDSIDEEYTYLFDSIQKSLKDISPIKPANVSGAIVNCNFRLPLVIKNTE